MNLSFRIAQIGDQKSLRALALLAYGDFEKDLSSENWKVFQQNLAAEETYVKMLSIAKCFVCEVEDKIVGVAYFVPSGYPTDIFAADWSYLRMVGVDPTYRGKGIGVQLTQHCIAFAKQSKEKIIALHTAEFMPAARAIYEKLGFRKVRELKPLFGKRYWLYHLRLDGIRKGVDSSS